jgi:hypothetical protein
MYVCVYIYRSHINIRYKVMHVHVNRKLTIQGPGIHGFVHEISNVYTYTHIYIHTYIRKNTCMYVTNAPYMSWTYLTWLTESGTGMYIHIQLCKQRTI